MTKRPFDYWLLWLVALISLAVNIWLINTLLVARRQVGEAAASAARSVEALRAASIDYTVHVEQSMPLSLTVPLSTTVTVPFNLQLPVNTEVTVPLKTILGTFDLNIPIKTTIPVNIQTQVPVQTTVPISATVPVVLDVPIHISLTDTSLDAALAEVQTYLEKVSTSLQSGVLQSPRPTP